MRRLNYSLSAALVTLAAINLLFPAGGSQTAGQSKKYIPVTKYDPKRDAAGDIQAASGKFSAKQTHSLEGGVV